MARLSLFVLVSLFLEGCAEDTDWKTQETIHFTIELPDSWTMVEVQGYDSFVRQIKTNQQEVISVDLGWYSNQLNVDAATHHIQLKTIDTRVAKIVQPKDFQSGTTGVYFELIDSSNNQLTINGQNLSPENQHLLRKAIETIRFH